MRSPAPHSGCPITRQRTGHPRLLATITASSLMTGLVGGLSTGQTSLVVLAVGAGSVFFSHVNDAGFWLVKEYFGLTVGQTLKTWSIMETLLSVVGLIFVLLLGLVL